MKKVFRFVAGFLVIPVGVLVLYLVTHYAKIAFVAASIFLLVLFTICGFVAVEIGDGK